MGAAGFCVWSLAVTSEWVTAALDSGRRVDGALVSISATIFGVLRTGTEPHEAMRRTPCGGIAARSLPGAEAGALGRARRAEGQAADLDWFLGGSVIKRVHLDDSGLARACGD